MGDLNVKVEKGRDGEILTKFGLGILNELGEKMGSMVDGKHSNSSQHLISRYPKMLMDMEKPRRTNEKQD